MLPRPWLQQHKAIERVKGTGASLVGSTSVARHVGWWQHAIVNHKLVTYSHHKLVQYAALSCYDARLYLLSLLLCPRRRQPKHGGDLELLREAVPLPAHVESAALVDRGTIFNSKSF